jgi:hypothetical protein
MNINFHGCWYTSDNGIAGPWFAVECNVHPYCSNNVQTTWKLGYNNAVVFQLTNLRVSLDQQDGTSGIKIESFNTMDVTVTEHMLRLYSNNKYNKTSY